MLSSGQTIGHYEILEKLGEGGMGVVYKARDNRLDRLVALKLLRVEKIGDEERIRRFAQEARAVSGLNHPNIVTIYEIGSENSLHFIAMEYVQGKPLEDLIPRKGMRLNEALKIAIQIADALTAAAAAGIVHRDLKPANVMVAESGVVKVLDFGLAKLPEPFTAEQTATITVDEERPRTREGTVLGTCSYMSPEQAEGRPLDARSDIFSFGALLYEMLTGQRAFRGETAMATLSAILRDDPKPVTQLCPDIPRDLEKIVNRCLRKDRERRFQHMADLRVALLELKEESESGKLPVPELPPRSMVRPWWLWGGVGVAVLILAGVCFFLYRRPFARSPEPVVVPFTSDAGYQTDPAFSPDANQIAFAWAEHRYDPRHIYAKVIGTDTPLRLTSGDKDDSSPAWAPEGQSIAFIRKLSDTVNAIYTVSPLGGSERRVAEIGAPGGPAGTVGAVSRGPTLSWSRGGKWLLTSGRKSAGEPSRILAIAAATGEVRALDLGGTVDEFWQSLSPDSRKLAFCRNLGERGIDIYTAELSSDVRPTGAASRLNVPRGFNGRPTWTQDGSEVIFENYADTTETSRLWRVPIRGTGSARPIEAAGQGAFDPAVAPQRNRLAFQHWFSDDNIWAIPVARRPASTPPRAVAMSTRVDVVRPNAFSPDGRKIVFESARSGPRAVWMTNADGSHATFLFGGAGYLTGSPAWSPDGRWIVFDTRKDGRAQIYIASVDGGAARRVTHDNVDDMVPSWSHDGNWIYFCSNRGGQFEVFKISPAGGAAIQVTHAGGWTPQESTDGRFIYYTHGRNQESPLFRTPVDGGPEMQVLPAVTPRCWTVGRTGVWFLARAGDHDELRLLDFRSKKAIALGRLDRGPLSGLAISPDENTLLYNQTDSFGTEILLMENFT